MFTGIVEEIGKVFAVERKQSGALLKIKSGIIYSDAKLGDSIAINGVCLTVVDIKKDIVSFDVIEETLNKSTLGYLLANGCVNLERSLRPDSKIGGHFVTGHVDYKGKVMGIRDAAGELKISLPAEFAMLIVEKGSVALDGVSLTVVNVFKDAFTVHLIPHTRDVTILGMKEKGDYLNVEMDILAKYASRQNRGKDNFVDMLKKYDYI